MARGVSLCGLCTSTDPAVQDTLKFNFGARIPNTYVDFVQFKQVYTLLNGRTYACIVSTSNVIDIFERTDTGLRKTAVSFDFQGDMDAKGNLWTRYIPDGFPYIAWQRKRLLGFDGNNDPLYSDWETMAQKPIYNSSSPDHVTTLMLDSNLVVFNPDKFSSYNNHLALIPKNGTAYKWQTGYSTPSTYGGPFPADGRFDDYNQVVYPGGSAGVARRVIIIQYHGENWHQFQTNYYMMFDEYGLYLGKFGTDAVVTGGAEAAPGMAGNAIKMYLVEVGGDLWLLHNDESINGGVHRWKIHLDVHYINFTLNKTSLPVISKPYTQLMAGVAYGATMQSGVSGWSTDKPYSYVTSYFSTDIATPDIFFSVDFRYNDSTRTTTRTLPVAGTDWALEGSIAYDAHNFYANCGAKTTVEVLDDNDNRLFYLQFKGRGELTNDENDNNDATGYIVANGVTVTKSDTLDVRAYQPFRIASSGSGLSFTYAGRTVALSIDNGAGAVKRAAKLRVVQNGGSYHNLGIEALLSKNISVDLKGDLKFYRY